MKVCFISQTVEADNGSGRFASSMIAALKTQYGIESVTLVERGTKESLPNTHAVLFGSNPVLKFIVNPILIAWYGRGARAMHAFDGWPFGVETYLASFLNRLPYVMSLYATYAVAPLYRKWQAPLMRRAYSASSLNAAISNITKRKLRDAWADMPVSVVLQGIAYDAYQENRKTPLADGIKYILIVGTMKQRKGYHYALSAFAKLRSRFPDLKLVIVASYGTDRYTEQINSQIKEMNLSDSIIRLSGLSEDELIGLYQRAQAFFLPSLSVDSPEYFEGFGSVYLEAQACGLPVVTSRGGGQEDALQDGKTGFLVEEGNIDAYAEALSEIIGADEKRIEMSRAAKEFARSMDWKNNVGAYYEILKRYER